MEDFEVGFLVGLAEVVVARELVGDVRDAFVLEAKPRREYLKIICAVSRISYCFLC